MPPFVSGIDDYESAFDANPLPCLIFDRESLRILRTNPAASALYGWSQAELLELTVRDIRLPEDVPRLEAALAEMRAQVPPIVRVTRHRTKDGRVFEAEARIGRLTFAGRDASMVIVKDLTGEFDRARLAQLVIQHSSDGFSIISTDRRLVYMSPGGERLLGVAPGTLDGTDPTELMHPDDRRQMRVIAPGETATNVVRTRRADGTYRWMESVATNLTLDPAVRAFITNFRDVTARVEAEQAIRRSEESFRVLAERSPTLLMVHRSGTVVYANPAIVRALGYANADQVVGRPVLDLVHPDDHASVRARIEHTARHGAGAPGEARMRRRDGSYIVTEGEGIVLDFDGLRSHVVVGNDVTERRELFARIALADRLLSVGTLAAGVAHEINNPLAYVSSNLELALRDLPLVLEGKPAPLSHAELLELLADAQEGASRVAAIVRELRALSRSTDELGSTDVAAVLASCLKIAHNELRHRARVIADIPATLPPALGAASRVGQVFLNLLVNAAQAFPPGDMAGNEVRVRAWSDDHRVLVEISDTGVGIAPNLLDRIFDPFFTTKPVGLGTGLGLSISHEIVRALGGSITVASEVGKGSTFRVAIPIATVPAPAPEPPPPARVEGSARVLVIDDEPAVGRAIALLLDPDYEVTVLTRARDGLARLAAGERYDAIVCDVMMPDMTGIDFYDQLSPETRRAVLLLTGGAFTPQARAFLDASTVPRLAKPFTERELRRAIEAVRAVNRRS